MKKTLIILFSMAVLLVFAGNGWAKTWTFDTDPKAEGWYTDRKAPSVFENRVFDGDSRLYMEHDGNAQHASSFYWTEGMKYKIGESFGPGYAVSIDMYLDASWNIDNPAFEDQRRFDIWGDVSDAGGGNAAWPIIGFANTRQQSEDDIAIQGFQVWDYGAATPGWQIVKDLTTDESLWGTWVNLKMLLGENAFQFFINDDLVYNDTTTHGALALDEIFIQGKNYDGVDNVYGVYFDNLQHSQVPVPAAVWLLGSGLVGLLGFRKKMKR
jgi:hypothetical protein